MSIRRSTRRITAWLSMLVLVLNALMPLAAQAMRASVADGNAIEICTSTGMMRLAQDEPSSPDGSFAAQSSCPFCLLYDGPAMLPPTLPALPLTQSYAGMPPAFYQAAPTSAVWLTALSRGPPSLLN